MPWLLITAPSPRDQPLTRPIDLGEEPHRPAGRCENPEDPGEQRVLVSGDDDGQGAEGRAVTMDGAHPDADIQDIQGAHPGVRLTAVEQLPIPERVRSGRPAFGEFRPISLDPSIMSF